MNNQKPSRKTKSARRRSVQSGGSTAAFTPATRAELMLLSCGVEECESALCNVASQLRHITAALGEIIHKTKPTERENLRL